MISTNRRYRLPSRPLASAASAMVLISLLTLGTAISGVAADAVSDLGAGEAALARGDNQSAARLLRPLADSGDIQARIDLASRTLDDRDLGIRPDQAVRWLTAAAEAGDGRAQARLGVAYAKGQHVAKNDLTAYRWLNTACQTKLPSDDAMTIAKSNRDAVLARLTPAQRAMALAGQTDAPSVPAVSASATSSPAGGQITAPTLATGNTTTTSSAAVSVLASDYRVQIGSLPSLAEARAEWHRLQRKLPALLGKKAGTIDDVAIAGIGKRYRVTTGPFADRNAARQFCASLKSAGQDCLVAPAIAATN